MRDVRGLTLVLVCMAALSHAETPAERAARIELERQLQAEVEVPPTKVRIDLVGLDEPNYELVEAVIELDGAPITVSPLKDFQSEGDHLVLHTDIKPGEHRLESRLQFHNGTSQVFSEEGGFTWKPGSVVKFRAEAGIEVQLKVTPILDRAAEIKNRIKIRTESAVKMLAKLDDGTMPEPLKRVEPESKVAAVVDAGTPTVLTVEAKREEVAPVAKRRREPEAPPDAGPVVALVVPTGVEVAQLMSFKGQVKTIREQKAPVAAVVGPLNAGDVVMTGAASSAVLRSQGHELELGQNTRFRVGQRLGGVTIEVQEGQISIVDAQASAGSVSLTLLTPYGEAPVVVGTKAKVSVTGSGLSADVELGSIVLVRADGQQRVAKAGQRMQLKLGSIEVVEQTVASEVDAGTAPVAETPVAPDTVPEGDEESSDWVGWAVLGTAALAAAVFWWRRKSKRNSFE